MPLHDAYARQTPYELLFPTPEAAAEVMDAIQAEADTGGLDPGDLADFMNIRAAADHLRALRPDDVGGEAIHRYAVLLQQAFFFHRTGRGVFFASTGVVRYVVAGAPGGHQPELPQDAGYLQLPQHLVWMGAAPATPESVDGAFWRVDAGRQLHLLLVTGVRGDRPGLAVVPLPPVPWDDAGLWLESTIRPDGSDFATELPGGELEGLYSLTSAGEPLKLFAGIWAYAAAFPRAVNAGPIPAPDDVAEGAPRPSRLPHTRISLDDAAGIEEEAN